MKQERRSRWYEWTCDLQDGCNVVATTHPAIDPDGDSQVPDGWVVVPPPKFWRGPALAFCSRDHHLRWARNVAAPMLLATPAAISPGTPPTT